MNCEICAEKFKRLKDVIQHGTSERHIQFFCIPCALSLPSVFDVVEHVASKEHSVTALATGVRFDTTDRSDFKSSSFPPHYLCLLCGYRCNTSINNHLKSDKHKYMAWLLRTIITSKKIYNSHRDSFHTRSFICKMIDAKRNTPLDDESTFHICSLRFVCDLCNLHFVKQEYLNAHLEDQSHTIMEQFLRKISRIAKGMDVIGTVSDMNETKTFNNSFRPLYYCEVCCLWIDTHFNYLQHRKSIRHENARLLLKQSKKRKMDDSSMDRVVTEGIVHRYPKLKTEKHAQHTVGEELAKIKQHCRKNKNEVSGCCGEKSFKKLKTSDSNSNDSSECVKRKMVKEGDSHRSSAREAIFENSSFLDSTVSETESHFQGHALKACHKSRSSLQLGAETSETDETPPRSDGNLCGKAVGTSCKLHSTHDIEFSETENNCQQHTLSVCGAARNSSLQLGVETSEADVNHPPRREINFHCEDLETICIVPPTLDIKDSETENHLQKHTFKACSSLQPSARETDENSTRSEDNFCDKGLEIICEAPSVLDIEVSETENHFQKNTLEACDTARRSSIQLNVEIDENLIRLDDNLCYQALESKQSTRSSSLQLCAKTNETGENPLFPLEGDFEGPALESLGKVPSSFDVRVSETDNLLVKHLKACGTTSSSLLLSTETRETGENPTFSENNLRNPALETVCKAPSDLDIEASGTENYFQKHELEACDTARRSSIQLNAEIDENLICLEDTLCYKAPESKQLTRSTSFQLCAKTNETGENPPSLLEGDLHGPALETFGQVPSSDTRVSETDNLLLKHTLKACGTASSSFLLSSETRETGENPTFSENNLLDPTLETICEDPTTLDIKVRETENHFQEHALEACGTTRSSSLQLGAQTSKTDKNPTCSEDNLRDQAVKTISTISSAPDIEVSETENHFQEHALPSCPTTRSVEISETDKNSSSPLKDGKMIGLRLNVEDGDADLCEEHYCELCDFLCYSSLNYGKHLMGERHRKMRRLINKKDKVRYQRKECEACSKSHPQQYNCELCDVFNHSSQEYEVHLNSTKHKKNKWLLCATRQKPVSVAVMRF